MKHYINEETLNKIATENAEKYQNNNPFEEINDVNADGFVLLNRSGPYQENIEFGGLTKSSNHRTWLDGTHNPSNNWFYAIAVKEYWQNNTMPAAISNYSILPKIKLSFPKKWVFHHFRM